MLPHSRPSPPAADSMVSPHRVARRPSHKHRFCISLLNPHSGQTPGHSSHSLSLFVTLSCIAFLSCFLSLSSSSIVSSYISCPFATCKSDPTLSPPAPFRIAPSNPHHRRCYRFQIASSLLSWYLTYTCNVSSCMTPSLETYCDLKL